MNKTNIEKRVQILRCLVDGNSIRATARICDVAINTVVKLLCDAGRACADYQNKKLNDLSCKRVQCDEIWSFIYAKDKNASPKMVRQGKAGDVWTWTAICADSKLAICWEVGPRDARMAYEFIHNLKGRLRSRVQLTTDGLKVYLNAIENAFGSDIDYALLIKMYGNVQDSKDSGKYSPGMCTGSRMYSVTGNPEYKHISTSFVERNNLTMRMNMRRFTRLTNAFSKKLENHVHAVSLHFMYYNFCRIHQSLRITPAMAAGVTDHVWEIEDVIALIK
ncbi:MAG: IS1 family transposase [Kiritimatiellae bacterium]|nr:IS1 family transposase [Kiritimatiellia bacterium]